MKGGYQLSNLGLFAVALVIIFVSAVASASYKTKNESFANYVMSPMSYTKPLLMSDEDGKRLQPDNGSTWRGAPPNLPHVGPEPSGDGLYVFFNNQCRADCCPSTYMCGMGSGCVCTNEKDRQYFNTRGGNRNIPDDSI